MEGGRRSSRFCVGERDISEERGKRWREREDRGLQEGERRLREWRLVSS
jgi:hypothetical protein